MSIRVLSKINDATEPLAFHRVIALLRTDRNREQKLVRPRLFALFPCHCPIPSYGFGPSPQSVHFYLSFNLSSSALCIFLPIPRYFSVTFFLSWSFLKCSFFKLGRTRISLMKFTLFFFFDNASRWPFPFPDLNFVPSASWEFCGVSRRSVQSHFLAFRKKDFIGSKFWDSQPWTLFSRRVATRSLLLTFSMSILVMNTTNASVSRLVTTTHGMMSIITWRPFSSCQP